MLRARHILDSNGQAAESLFDSAWRHSRSVSCDKSPKIAAKRAPLSRLWPPLVRLTGSCALLGRRPAWETAAGCRPNAAPVGESKRRPSALTRVVRSGLPRTIIRRPSCVDAYSNIDCALIVCNRANFECILADFSTANRNFARVKTSIQCFWLADRRVWSLRASCCGRRRLALFECSGAQDVRRCESKRGLCALAAGSRHRRRPLAPMRTLGDEHSRCLDEQIRIVCSRDSADASSSCSRSLATSKLAIIYSPSLSTSVWLANSPLEPQKSSNGRDRQFGGFQSFICGRVALAATSFASRFCERL